MAKKGAISSAKNVSTAICTIIEKCIFGALLCIKMLNIQAFLR